MMDLIIKICQEIGCPELIGKFEEQQIDDSIIVLVEEEQLKEIIPLIGPRVRFKKLLKNYTEDLSVIILDSKTTFSGTTKDALEVNYQENSEIPFTDITLTTSTEDADVPTTLEVNEPLTVDFLNELSEHPAAPYTTTSKVVHTNPDVKEIQEKNRASLDGRAVLREGNLNNGLLTEAARRKLSQLLIFEALEKEPTKTITAEEFSELATEICQIFNREKPVIYYSAYQASAKGKNKKNASGKLYETYISRRRKLRDGGFLVGTSRRSSSKSSSSSVSTQLDDVDDDTEVLHDENIAWLKNNVDPWEEVEERWIRTTDVRKTIIDASGKIDDYFKTFPALKLPQGYRLLMNDFKHLYPGKDNNFFSKITLFKDNIIDYAKSKKKTIRDKYAKAKIQEYVALINDDPESSTNVALMLLAYVVNSSPARRHKDRPVWKPSRSEVAEAFIAHAVSEADVTAWIISKRETLSKLGRTLQPFVIFVGETAAQVKRAYVVINNETYKFQKLVTAVDCAFKLFQATGACYPEEAEDLWTVIQIGFYNITTPYDRKSQAVNCLLTDLGL